MQSPLDLIEVSNWLTLITWAGELALGLVILTRWRDSPAVAPLAALCLVAFGWNFAVWAHAITGVYTWHYVDWTISPMTGAVSLHFMLCFVRQRRRLRVLMWFVYAAYASISLASATAFFSEWGRQFAGGEVWEILVVTATVPTFSLAVFQLLRHLRNQLVWEEQMRTRLVIAAALCGAMLTMGEVMVDRFIVLPSTLISVSVLAVATLRFRLVESANVSLAVTFLITLVVIGALGTFVALQLFAVYWGLGVLSISLLIVVLGAFAIQTIAKTMQRHAQLGRLAMLGRISFQMAHDLKTPLAAINGAVQFLKEERAQGRTIDNQVEFLDLIIEKTDSLTRLIMSSQRLGKLKPTLKPVLINRLVEQIAALYDLHAVSVLKLELAQNLPECHIDADLITTALQNLVVNSAEASSPGSDIVIRTETVNGESPEPSVAISVIDEGQGMNPREIEQAFDEFYTTKTTGSGLGLPLIRRVVDAHHGSLRVTSRTGKGTQVVVELPAIMES
ncbi:MAG: hypothetical protein GY847_36915 [Proteobacteria bacterium]|nr:hypothetical protein [Pseudomonadota bacterium]